MLTSFALAFVAGLVTILNPCVLPLVPILAVVIPPVIAVLRAVTGRDSGDRHRAAGPGGD